MRGFLQTLLTLVVVSIIGEIAKGQTPNNQFWLYVGMIFGCIWTVLIFVWEEIAGNDHD